MTGELGKYFQLQNSLPIGLTIDSPPSLEDHQKTPPAHCLAGLSSLHDHVHGEAKATQQVQCNIAAVQCSFTDKLAGYIGISVQCDVSMGSVLAHPKSCGIKRD